MDKGRFALISRLILCRRVLRGKPRFTLVSDGNPLRLLLLGSWKEVVEAHCSFSYWMDLPVTSQRRTAAMDYKSRH
jgi:hypothetical protein